MTKDEIFAVARECHDHFSDLRFVFSGPEVERFSDLVAAAGYAGDIYENRIRPHHVC